MVTTIASFSTEAIYNLIIDEKNGVATRCTCKGHQYRGHCKHQDTFNQEVQKAAAFILLQERVKVIEAQTSDVLQTRRIRRELAFA